MAGKNGGEPANRRAGRCRHPSAQNVPLLPPLYHANVANLTPSSSPCFISPLGVFGHCRQAIQLSARTLAFLVLHKWLGPTFSTWKKVNLCNISCGLSWASEYRWVFIYLLISTHIKKNTRDRARISVMTDVSRHHGFQIFCTRHGYGRSITVTIRQPPLRGIRGYLIIFKKNIYGTSAMVTRRQPRLFDDHGH